MDIKSYISSGIIEQYVLGVLPQEESAILECIIKHNTEVSHAVLEAQKTIENFSELQAVEPPAFLKNKITAQLDFDNSIKNNSFADNSTLENQASENVITTNKSFKSSNIWAVAASVLLLISVGWNFYTMNNATKDLRFLTDNNKKLKSQLDNMADANNLMLTAKKIQLKGVKQHSNMLANVFWNSSHKVFLHLDNLPKAPEGKQYQLWAIVDGKPVDAGLYDSENPKSIQPMKKIDNAQAFAITLEKKGGSTVPTMDEMYVIGNT